VVTVAPAIFAWSAFSSVGDGAGDDLCLELQHVAHQRDADVALIGGHGNVLKPIADAPYADRLRSAGNGEGEAAVVTGMGADGRARHGDRCCVDGLTRARLRYYAR
jgi:hypothetical protein